MSDTKGSGLRQPSKIGRPCCPVQPKPTVPPSPPRSSMNSMEPTHENARRKDGGEHRRGSDTSVVLTEDTDSFIIGDRVWVGGTKPGSIAYIGETQFAPGDWAGVVLDESIGKNDGSVAGSRYFQCAPKHGIFSRLTRLTRYPLQESSLTSPSESKSPPANKSVSPSLNVSMTSLNSSISHRDLKIGDRVIVSSGQGSKTGVLRYLGTTEFAAGEWCGVELDEAAGKNDGSVGDIRYFECKIKHGLFAPMHKVSRSPSSKRSSMCAVHKPTGAALNSSLRKTGSRESLTSISSVTSTTSNRGVSTARRPRASTPGPSTLQEMLKEKQQEIEMLRRERDLERERISKAATQADNAEQSIVDLKLEYDKYREEMEKNVVESQATLSRLIEDKNNLYAQLDEERQKCEDLLFRFEEELLNKEDIQKEKSAQTVVNVQNEEKIQALEKELAEERERVIQLERDNTRLFETGEELAKLKIETSNLTALENTNLCLKEAKITLENQMLERNNTITELSSQISELQQKLKNREEVEKSNIEKFAEDLRICNEEQNLLLGKVIEENAVKIETTLEENKKLHGIIENLTQENVKACEIHQIESTRILIEKENLSAENLQRITELEKLIMEESQKTQEENERALKIGERNSELEKLVENFQHEIKKSEIEIKERDEKLAENSKLIVALEQKYLSVSHDQENNMTELGKLRELLRNTSTENTKLIEELNNNSGKFVSLDEEINLLKSQLINKNGEIDNMFEKITELNDSITFFEQTKTNLESELKMYESNIWELNKKLKFSDEKFQGIILEKEKLEQDISRIISNSEGSSEELKKYNEELRIKEKENAKLKEEIFDVQNLLENSKEKLRKNEECSAKMIEKMRANEKKLVEQVKENQEYSKKLQVKLEENEKICENFNEKFQDNEVQIQKLNAKLKENEENFGEIQKSLMESEENCEKLSAKLKESTENIIEIQKKLEESKDYSSKLIEAKCSMIQELEKKIENLEKNSAILADRNQELVEIISQLEDKNQTLEKNLENEYKRARESEEILKVQVEQLHKENIERIEKLDEEKSKLSSVLETWENTSENYEKSTKIIQELNDKILSLNMKLDSSQKYSSKMEKLILEKEEENSKLAQVSETLVNTGESYRKAQETIQALNSEILSLKSALSGEGDRNSEKLKKLEETIKQQNLELGDLNGRILELSTEKDRLKILDSEKSKIEARLGNLIGEKSENQEKLKILETRNEDLKNAVNKKTEMIDELVKVVETLKTAENESCKSVELEFAQKLKESSENISKITQELSNTKMMNETYRIDMLDKSDTIASLNQVIENLERRIRELESENAWKNSELISRSQKIEERNSELIEENQKIDQKNIEIHSRLARALEEIKKLQAISNNNLEGKIEPRDEENGETDHLKTIIEENQTFKGQIDFLNSVIVDMQKKNENLKIKIEVLEMGVPANEANDYSKETLRKVLTPRMFCDICDEFDLHETEDCPKQSQDFEIEKTIKKTPVKDPVERAYCDHCEIFGHDTVNCDDAETF